MYRRPDLYDHLAGDADDLLAVIEQLTRGSEVGSVLDLGCGTGRHLAALQAAVGCEAVGIDLQPRLIEYGQARHPNLDLMPGDIRAERLGRQFDLVLCLGNSLSYLLTDADLRAAAETFSAHTKPGGNLLVATMLKPPLGNSTAEVRNELVTASVEIESSWDAVSRVVTTTRRWRHWNDSFDEDVMRRRVTPLDELGELLGRAGFGNPRVVDRDTDLVIARKPLST